MSIEAGVGTTVADFATVVTGLLDRLDYDDVALLADRKQLELVVDLLTVQSRLSGMVHTVLGQADRAEAAMTAHGIPTVSWLASELRYTRSQASTMVHHAADLHRFTQIGDSLRATAEPTTDRPSSHPGVEEAPHRPGCRGRGEGTSHHELCR